MLKVSWISSYGASMRIIYTTLIGSKSVIERVKAVRTDEYANILSCSFCKRKSKHAYLNHNYWLIFNVKTLCEL